MATLQIRKKSTKVWAHIPSDGSEFILSKLYAKTDAGVFKVVEDSGSNRKEYDYTNITVYDDTGAGTPETFASAELLMLRLEELSYVGFNRDGDVPPTTLSSLTDVDVSGVTDGQFLVWNDTLNTWEAGDGVGAVSSVNTQTGAVVLDQDDVLDGATYKQYSATEKTKLAGIATGATANSSDAALLARANHTGTQLASTISDFAATVRATTITGLSLATSQVIAATDTVLQALGYLQAQITALSVKQITITTSTSITTATLDGSSVSQYGKNVFIDNSTNAINLTVNGVSTTPVTYFKHGTGAITFVQGSGRTLIQVNGTAVLSGAVGSTASLASIGTTDYLRIANA